MYVDAIRLQNLKTFVDQTIEFVHPDRPFSSQSDNGAWPKPRLPNVNLLLGDNGAGKTTIMQAIVLAAFGPAAMEANLGARRLVRIGSKHDHAHIDARLHLHEQDGAEGREIESPIMVSRRGELERISFGGEIEIGIWDRVFESENDSFFIAAYGATRRIEPGESLDMGARSKSRFLRAQRVQSVFQDSFSLIPLTYWLPNLKKSNRHQEVVGLINHLLGPGHYKLNAKMREGDYLFDRGKMSVPLQSLSDGYRALISWVGDLLYHLHLGCPASRPLNESRGVVLVDEVDLHLHPRWQMEVVEKIARSLPRIQFVFTTHSPLVTGRLQRMNVIHLRVGRSNSTQVSRSQESFYGLDADQILLTDLFGLESTRPPAKNRQIAQLTARATSGDDEAAKKLISALARGLEDRT